MSDEDTRVKAQLDSVRLEERLRYEELLLEKWTELEHVKTQLSEQTLLAKDLQEQLSKAQADNAKLQKKVAKVQPPARKARADPLRKNRKRPPPKPLDQKVAEKQWNEKFEKLLAFKQAHGHCNVSTVTSDPEQKTLAGWVSKQRTEHKAARLGLTNQPALRPDRIRRLVEIGFCFSLAKSPTFRWEERYAQLVEYREKAGHSNVSQTVSDDAVAGLGNWVSQQRRRHKALRQSDGTIVFDRVLTPERYEKMQAIGFVWALRDRGNGTSRRRAWEDDGFHDAEEQLT
jgi:hypothetical protein